MCVRESRYKIYRQTDKERQRPPIKHRKKDKHDLKLTARAH